MDAIEKAIEALKAGKPIMIFDGEDREGEVDLVYHASHATPAVIHDLRVNAGGLICYATTWEIARGLGLIWGSDLIAMHPPLRPLTMKTPSYGDKPAFTIWVNHVSTKTGITDKDRSKTVQELDRVVETYHKDPEKARRMFQEGFQAPGHVPVLAARSLSERRGHTELSVCLARLAGLRPSVVFAEMLDYGTALPYRKAEKIAERRGIPLIRGDEIVEVCMP
ncbi:MAG: 3,4-dihydroxy-2-butanone-4-phosphate synthase [Desulfurococcales archaeon]|nr:3,4-dihydroxy-2-butanone-4-phosphate synthase [Desulfurococcales archaeon]